LTLKADLLSCACENFREFSRPCHSVAGPLSRVFEPVQAQLDEVDRRITAQTSAFDPAIEGYVAYAIGGGGKRLRPLVALLAGGATGSLTPGHLDLAVIVN
jgi:geranylgeranyl pyrophosphate synthase